MVEKLSVVSAQTTDRIRLSKQAKTFLNFLSENNVNGEVYSREDKFELQNPEPFTQIDTKRINGKWVVFYRRGISLIQYIEQKAFPNSELFVSSISGYVMTHNHSLRNSLERTIRRLCYQRLVERFRHGKRYCYFITLKGKHILRAKERLKYD